MPPTDPISLKYKFLGDGPLNWRNNNIDLNYKAGLIMIIKKLNLFLTAFSILPLVGCGNSQPSTPAPSNHYDFSIPKMTTGDFSEKQIELMNGQLEDKNSISMAVSSFVMEPNGSEDHQYQDDGYQFAYDILIHLRKNCEGQFNVPGNSLQMLAFGPNCLLEFTDTTTIKPGQEDWADYSQSFTNINFGNTNLSHYFSKGIMRGDKHIYLLKIETADYGVLLKKIDDRHGEIKKGHKWHESIKTYQFQNKQMIGTYKSESCDNGVTGCAGAEWFVNGSKVSVLDYYNRLPN